MIESAVICHSRVVLGKLCRRAFVVEMSYFESLIPLPRVTAFFRRRFQLWLQRRLRPSIEQQLNNRRLFIFPSSSGFGFLLLVLLLWLLGTNYENNLVLALTYFLAALFVVTIHHTFFNLSGLTLRYLNSHPSFIGDQAEVLLEVSCEHKQAKENIGLSYVGGSQVSFDLIDRAQQQIKLFVPCTQRGWFNPGRVLVESFFPLGIIRCWSWLDMDAQILVYPKPIATSAIPLSLDSGEGGDKLDRAGSEDFHGFKTYEMGMPTKHIAWKHYAQGKGLLTKEYVSYRQQRIQLDWHALSSQNREIRLSQLCYWVLKLSATEQDYGLSLPGIEFPPGKGLAHKQQLLKALALFQWEMLGE